MVPASVPLKKFAYRIMGVVFCGMRTRKRASQGSKKFLSFFTYYWMTDLGVRSLSWKHKGLLMEVLMLCLEHGKEEWTGYMMHCDGTFVTDVELIGMYGGGDDIIDGLRAIRNAGQLTFDHAVGGWYNRVVRHWWESTRVARDITRRVDRRNERLESARYELDKWSKLENEMRVVGLAVEGGMLEVMQRMFRRANIEVLVGELVRKVRQEKWEGDPKVWLSERGMAADG